MLLLYAAAYSCPVACGTSPATTKYPKGYGRPCRLFPTACARCLYYMRRISFHEAQQDSLQPAKQHVSKPEVQHVTLMIQQSYQIRVLLYCCWTKYDTRTSIRSISYRGTSMCMVHHTRDHSSTSVCHTSTHTPCYDTAVSRTWYILHCCTRSINTALLFR